MSSDQLAVVTGTSAGIGRAVAACLLERNWRVVGISRRVAELHDHNYSHVALDLSDLEATERYFTDEFAREFPAGDFRRVGLVNNAALLEPVVPAERVPMAALARAFAVNTIAPVWLTGFFAAHCGHTPLRIVNLSSGAATNAMAGWTAYCATKAALLMAGRVFGAEAEHVPATRRKDAALLSYSPGIVDTAMQAHVRTRSLDEFPEVQRFVQYHEQGQLKDPMLPAREIADFLARDHQPPFSEARIGG